MTEELGPSAWGREEEEVFLGRDWMRMRNYSEEVAAKIDEEVREIVDKCYNRAKEILNTHRKELDEVVRILLDKEVIEGGELRKLLKRELQIEEEEVEPEGKALERVNVDGGNLDKGLEGKDEKLGG